MKSNWKNAAVFGVGVGVALYLSNKVKKAGEAAVDTVAKPIADAILFLTLPGEVQVKGDIIFPDGSYVPVNNVRLDSEARFLYRGTRWQIYSRSGASFLARKV